MNFSKNLQSQGHVNVASVKRAYSLTSGQVQQMVDPPQLVGDPKMVDGQLQDDTDLFRKVHFTDVIVKGHIHTPANQPQTTLEAGVRVGSVFRQMTVTGQRFLDTSSATPRFTPPEPFTKIPLIWEEAYGGTDSPNEDIGDLWDLKKTGESMGKDLSFLNLCRYRRNPFGKGYVLQIKPEHEGMPLPRIEFSDDRLTLERLVVGQPLSWHAMPSPACFLWQPYGSFPRMCFLGGKISGAMNDQVPHMDMPEFTFGYTRADLFEQMEADKLVEHPRFFNGAHPALQVPSLTKTTPITLFHFDPDQPEFTFHLPCKPPTLKLVPPGQNQTYRATGQLSTVVIDMDQKQCTTTWHCFVRTRLPVLPDFTDNIEWDVSW